MANEEMVIDVVVNGKKAQVELKKVESSVKDVGTESKETESLISKSTGAIKAGWAAVAVAVTAAVATLGVAINKARELSKATFGLTDSMKSYIEATSNATGMTQEMIAGFVQTGRSAGMSNGEIKKMIDTARALSKAYPQESIETFIDNLSMLNTTGEAQGYIVDVLEQKWGTIDLKGKTLAEKLAVIDEKTKGVNASFNKTAGAKIDQIFIKADNALTKLGQSALGMINKWGWLDTVNTKMNSLLRYFKGINEYTLKDANIELEKQSQLVTELEEKKKKAFSWTKPRYRAQLTKAKQRVAQIKARIRMLKEETVAEEDNTRRVIHTRNKELEHQKEIEKQKETLKETEVEKVKEGEKAKQAAIAKTGAVNKFITGQMADTITQFVMTGKASFKDFMLTVIAYLLKIRIAKAISSSGILGGLGFHTGTTEVKHTGGRIGNLPSHHTGSLRTDERIAKLQVGEAVVNRAGANKNQAAIAAMNAGQQVGGAVQQTTAEINFNVTAIDSSSFNNYLVGNRQVIENIINRSLTTNGSVRQTIKQVI